MFRKQTKQAIQLKVVRSPQGSSLELAADGFYLSREAMRCTEGTLIWYRKYVGALVDYLAGRDVQGVEGITADHLRAFLVQLQDRGLADTTVHHHASAARTFCNYLVEEELLTESPMRRVKMPRLNKDALPALSPEDVQKLLKACRTTRDTAMILALLDSAARRSGQPTVMPAIAILPPNPSRGGSSLRIAANFQAVPDMRGIAVLIRFEHEGPQLQVYRCAPAWTSRRKGSKNWPTASPRRPTRATAPSRAPTTAPC